MSFALRDAGAMKGVASAVCTVSLSLLALALPDLLHAATPRLRDARPAELRGNVTPQGADSSAGDPARIRLQLQWDGGRELLLLRPNPSLGLLAERLEGRATAWSGTLAGRTGSWAALTQIGERWTGIWFDGTHYFGIDDARSLAPFNPQAARTGAGRLMVFRLADLKLEGASHEGDLRPIDGSMLARELAGMHTHAVFPPPPTASAVLPTQRLAVALVADEELAAQDGPMLESNMLARLNIVDGIFASQVGVHLQNSSITIPGVGAEPPDTRVAGDLLDWLRGFRLASTQQRAAGLSHFMTGRDLDGRTVGIAYISGLCSTMYSGSLSQATGSIHMGALIAAHEIGHVFGAPHDGEAGSACAATPETFLMAGQIADSSDFSACSLEQMQPVLSRSCLAPYDAADVTLQAPQQLSIATGIPTDIAITVRSVGRAVANNASLRVMLPIGATLQSASAAAMPCQITGQTADCLIGTMTPGQQVAAVVRVQYDTTATGVAQLRATADNDALSSNDRASIVIDAAPGTDLVLSPASGTQSVMTGEDVTTVLVLENRGPAAVNDARLTVQIPAGLQLTQHAPDGLVCAPVTQGLTCGPQPLAAGTIARLSLTMRATVPASYVLEAVASASAPEILASNNQTSLQYNVGPTGGPGPGTGSASGGGGGKWPAAGLLPLACLAVREARRRQLVAAVK